MRKGDNELNGAPERRIRKRVQYFHALARLRPPLQLVQIFENFKKVCNVLVHGNRTKMIYSIRLRSRRS